MRVCTRDATFPLSRLRSPRRAYPTKSIRLIVGSSAGGGGDTFARVTAQALSNVLGQQVVIDNRAGRAEHRGDLVAQAPPDGYTLLLVDTRGTRVESRACIQKLPFDTVRDFAPVSLLATNDNLPVVNPSLPAKSLTEFCVSPKEAPERYYASAGYGRAGITPSSSSGIRACRARSLPIKATASSPPRSWGAKSTSRSIRSVADHLRESGGVRTLAGDAQAR